MRRREMLGEIYNRFKLTPTRVPPMAGEGCIRERIFRRGVEEIVAAIIARLCVDVSQLNDRELCCVLDFANDDFKFQITLAQLKLDISEKGVTREKKKTNGIRRS